MFCGLSICIHVEKKLSVIIFLENAPLFKMTRPEPIRAKKKTNFTMFNGVEYTTRKLQICTLQI